MKKVKRKREEGGTDLKPADQSKGKIDFFVQRTIRWHDQTDSVELIDQTKLPQEFCLIRCQSVRSLIHAIKTMQIRGAPAIGVAGAMGVALAAKRAEKNARTRKEMIHQIEADASEIADARPTAVNLRWGVRNALDFLKELPENSDNGVLSKKLIEFAKKLADEDVEANKKLAEIGQKLIPRNASVLTHCN